MISKETVFFLALVTIVLLPLCLFLTAVVTRMSTRLVSDFELELKKNVMWLVILYFIVVIVTVAQDIGLINW